MLSTLVSGDLEVLVSKAKNYKSFTAKSSFLAANPDGQVDSVAIICAYLDARGGEIGDFLFSNFARAKGGGIRFLNTPISKGNAVKLLREGMNKSGSLGDKFTLHSLKTGSISEARNTGRCSKEELRRHARWASCDMVDYYHNQSLEVKLCACKSLELFLPA